MKFFIFLPSLSRRQQYLLHMLPTGLGNASFQFSVPVQGAAAGSVHSTKEESP